tara:strand:+ start:31 stop:1122 length:1092 start_codon:yes stop_codon:yes gene_type:complete
MLGRGELNMANDIMATSNRFFDQIVGPLLEKHHPHIHQKIACGFFGYGSECLSMDDQLSRDHHWGLRIDALLPRNYFAKYSETLTQHLKHFMPDTFEGIPLRDGHIPGTGIALEAMEDFLRRTIGIEHAPRTDKEWLDIPEVDIIHLINGEVWHDPFGKYTAIRKALLGYYPDNVWYRRIAHWARYYSGMGVYALHRALQRDNYQYAHTAFSRSLKWAIELGFLLNRTYFPYDKWLLPFFKKLPNLTGDMVPLIEVAIKNQTPWEKRLDILNNISDLLDNEMIRLQIISHHPRFSGNESSGYRLLEHAYGSIIKRLPKEIKHHVPCWDQVFLEEFHTSYVDSISLDEWNEILCLTPEKGLIDP